jgi:2-oxoglutarate ferredoxin oxidoreductase subunit alpha
MEERRLMKGNEAFAEAALAAGCRCYFGYPITPQNEITEYMSREMPKWGGAFVQAESELAAISMAYGAAASGERALVTSSSPGIALMQEGISFLCSVDVPLVIVNVSRGGPGVGGIQPGQADYFQATRGGGNGDYHVIVYAPASIQEAMDKMGQAYAIAEKYRNPVMLLVDGMLGQMMEPVSIPERLSDERIDAIRKAKTWAVTGHGQTRRKNVIKSLRLKPEELELSIEERGAKYADAEKNLVEFDATSLDRAEVVFVAFGSTSRIVKEAMGMLDGAGVKCGLIRPVSLWPFPYKAFDLLAEETRVVVSVELSMGQMIQDVKLGVLGRKPVELIYRTGGSLLTPENVVSGAKKMLEAY